MNKLKRFRIIAILMVILTVGGMVAAVSAPAEASRMVYIKHMKAYAHVDTHRHPYRTNTWHNHATVHWNWDHYAGDSKWGSHAWAAPQDAWVTVDAPGNIEPCGILDGYNGTTVRFTFYDHVRHKKYRTHSQKVNCAFNTYAGVWVDFSSEVPRLHFASGKRPTFKAYFRTQLDIFSDPTGNAYGSFVRK